MGEYRGPAGLGVADRGPHYKGVDVAPVKKTLSAAGQSGGEFSPILGRPFNATHKPTGSFSGSYQLERKFGDDATWYVVLGYSDLASLPETFAMTETEEAVVYRWTLISVSAGSVATRLSA